MRAITSFNKKLYDKYAHRLIETIHNFPGELWVYSEDKAVKTEGQVVYKDLHQLCPKLEKFKEKMAGWKPPSWELDVNRFANKVFALCHGAWDAKGLVVWLDADCTIYNPIPEEFLKSLLPEDCYWGYFGRPHFTETGFHILNADHPEHKNFLESFRNVYLDGTIFKLSQWHDCMAFDYARLNSKARFHNLTTGNSNHPIVVSELGKYIDHAKGRRKETGISPENKWRVS